MEMSVGLATLGNKGKRAKPFFIREIRDAAGEVIYTAKPQLTAALSPAAALDATSVLSRENSTRTFTGATGSDRDAWTLRLGPSGSTAIWIGFDKPAAIAPEKRLNSLLEEFVKRSATGETPPVAGTSCTSPCAGDILSPAPPPHTDAARILV